MSTFGNVLVFSLVAFTSAWSATASEAMLKQQSRKEFKLGRHRRAIEFARQATEAEPTDAEAWYLRGWSLFYLRFDSRPLSGATRATSDSILNFLERATRLDPKLGDACYAIGACYGDMVVDELGEGNVKQWPTCARPVPMADSPTGFLSTTVRSSSSAPRMRYCSMAVMT